jgi:hypothetical protein
MHIIAASSSEMVLRMIMSILLSWTLTEILLHRAAAILDPFCCLTLTLSGEALRDDFRIFLYAGKSAASITQSFMVPLLQAPLVATFSQRSLDFFQNVRKGLRGRVQHSRCAKVRAPAARGRHKFSQPDREEPCKRSVFAELRWSFCVGVTMAHRLLPARMWQRLAIFLRYFMWMTFSCFLPNAGSSLI